MRVFQALLTVQVRRSQVEIHSFVLMGTHFHLLVRSPRGRGAALAPDGAYAERAVEATQKVAREFVSE